MVMIPMVFEMWKERDPLRSYKVVSTNDDAVVLILTNQEMELINVREDQ